MLTETKEFKTSLSSRMYYFQIPTEVTKMEPVFLFRFSIAQEMEHTYDILLNVALNPKLMESGVRKFTTKIYEFDSEGLCRFNQDRFQDYFIEGEIKLFNHEHISNHLTNRRCFVNITYGKQDEALHFIKGQFELTLL